MSFEPFPQWYNGVLYSSAQELGDAIAQANTAAVPVIPSPGDPVPADPNPTISVIDSGE